MKDKLTINIRLGHLKPMPLKIDYRDEELNREAERLVQRTWTTWMESLNNQTSEEVMARVAFHYTKLFLQYRGLHNASEEMLTQFEADLDRMLADLD